jgi:acyl-CoA reductase-like NAD-dependent aldehyde dehydrogenase
MNNPDLIPSIIPNWIDGREEYADSKKTISKCNPANGTVLYEITASGSSDVQKAVDAAKKAQPAWARTPPVRRGEILHDIVTGMKRYRSDIAEIVHLETGKSLKDALGETDGAIQCALFFAGEGQRMYGKTCTSGMANKYAMTIRQPIGIAGLIIAANTPVANVAWKIFPALICGNAAILKAAKDTPATSWIVGKIAHEAGLPPGLLNIIQGRGEEAGSPIVEHPDIGVISFTGSTEIGRYIAETAGKRLARISLELGGKNPLVVCDDANLENAVKWVILSAFSNAGQRCAAASRIIIFDSVYDKFRHLLIEKTEQLNIGTADSDDFGPVINESQLNMMISSVEHASRKGAHILTGGTRLSGKKYMKGFFMAPTIIDNIGPSEDISTKELFGPVICLYRVQTFEEAVSLANNTQYGLTACIHSRNIHRAMEFTQRVQTGVAVINAGTYGSEPHMPFGGMKQSGNGTREPGTEALDVYSEIRDVYIVVDEKEF